MYQPTVGRAGTMPHDCPINIIVVGRVCLRVDAASNLPLSGRTRSVLKRVDAVVVQQHAINIFQHVKIHTMASIMRKFQSNYMSRFTYPSWEAGNQKL